jgi:hypothetical protein
MVFHFFDVDTTGSGNELLVDSHTAASSGAVPVAGGLFNVQLGSGTVTDGAGPGTYASLADVFRDLSDVWLEIVVEGQILSPRTRLVSVPYSHNADNLDGKNSSEFLDTTSTPQTKHGELVLANEGGALPSQSGMLTASGSVGVSGMGFYAGVRGEGSTVGVEGVSTSKGYRGLQCALSRGRTVLEDQPWSIDV